MKKFKNCSYLLFGLFIIAAAASCSDDPSDCGFPAVIEARENYLAANQAISNASVPGAGGPTPAQCAAFNNAIADFEDKVSKLEPNCLNENDKANLFSWTLEAATAVTC